MTGIYAVGQRGEPVRILMRTDRDNALAQRRDGEVCCVLNSMPLVPVMITQDGQDVVVLPVPLDRQKADRWVEARIYRDARMNGGCWVSSGGGIVRVDSDPDSQRKLNGAVSAALVSGTLGKPFSIGWTMADNSVVELDGPAIISVAMQVVGHINACQVAGTAIREAIEVAVDEEALRAVDITAGYPATDPQVPTEPA